MEIAMLFPIYMFWVYAIGIATNPLPLKDRFALENRCDQVRSKVSHPGVTFIDPCGFSGATIWAELRILFLRFPRHATAFAG
jgi:hypothetical protein